MKRALLTLCFLGTLGIGMIVVSNLSEIFQPTPGARIDVGFTVFLVVEAILFPVATVWLWRDLRENPPDAPPLIEPTDENYAAVMTYERARRRRVWLVGLSPFLAFAGCCGNEVYNSYLIVRENSEYKVCVNALRRIDPAIQEFVAANHRPPRSIEELRASGKLAGDAPKCIAGGTYGLGKNQAGAVVGTCSVHGSLDALTPQKHPH